MKKNIREFFPKTRNPHEIARLSGANIRTVRHLMIQDGLSDLPGWGPVRLQRHIVSRRRTGSGIWPQADAQLLLDTRRAHDQGRVTMCQGNTSGWVIQYAIPTKRLVRRVPYFFGG